MILFEPRASIILYNVLKSLKNPKKFLLPLNVCPIVPAVFLKANIHFDFIDISLDTLCMDEQLIYDAIAKDNQIGGILFVKTFGTSFDSQHIFQKIKSMNDTIFIIDDCCLQIPNFNYDIENNFADMALFSTGYSKYIDINWGGFAFLKSNIKCIKTCLPFNQIDLDNLTSSMHQSIKEASYLQYKDTNWLGSNTVLYEHFESYKNIILAKTTEMIKHKELLNSIYEDRLPKEIQLGNEYSTWRFSILIEDKEALLKEIFLANLFANSLYGEIAYMYKKNYQLNSNAKKIHNKIINLFNDFRFNEEQAIQITDIIIHHLQR